jgi:hypothetical protein
MRLVWCVLLLLIPTEVLAQDQAFRVSLASAVVAHGADLAETQRCLGSGRCRETNPLLLRFDSPSGFAVAKMGLATVTLWVTATKIHPEHPRWALALNLAQTAGFALVAVHNARQGK